MRPEVLGIIGLAVAAVASLAIFLRVPIRSLRDPGICPHCGSVQPVFSRPASATRALLGAHKCYSCGQPMVRPRS
jgi:hypothetical protein